jgi:thymidylate synthase (FAD)
MEPKATVIAYTKFLERAALTFGEDEEAFDKGQLAGSELANLIEFAGRVCYDSLGKGRPSAEYHANILASGHGSVTEHASITFLIEGVSRALTHELVRHRVGTAISQECLSGDTRVKFRTFQNGRVHRARWRTLEDLYRLAKDPTWRHLLPKMHPVVLDEKSNSFVSGHLLDVVSSGIKPCFDVELEDGSRLRCTANHRIFTNQGWKTLSEIADPVLSPQESSVLWKKDTTIRVATNGFLVAGRGLYRNPDWLRQRYRLEGKSLSEMAGESECSTHVIRTWLRKHGLTKSMNEINRGKIPWNKGKTYSFTQPRSKEARARDRQAKLGALNPGWKGGVGSEARREFQCWKKSHKSLILDRDGYTCRLCHRHSSEIPPCRQRKRTIEINHIIPIWNRPDLACEPKNMATLCWQCHCRINGKELEVASALFEAIENPHPYAPKSDVRPLASRRLQPKWEAIKTIRYAGERETFDLVLEGPNHGFVADGVVVHNSTRYVDASEQEWAWHPLVRELIQDTALFEGDAETLETSARQLYESLVGIITVGL